MSSSLVNSLAKVYDPRPLQKSGARKLSLGGYDKSQVSSSTTFDTLRCVESRMDSLSSQMERLLIMQQTVLTRLDGLYQDVRGMGRDLALMREEGNDVGSRRSSGAEVSYRELRGAVERTSESVDSQGRRLDTVEKLVEGTQQVISFVGEVVKSSRLVELLFKQPGTRGNRKVSSNRLAQARAGHGLLTAFRINYVWKDKNVGDSFPRKSSFVVLFGKGAVMSQTDVFRSNFVFIDAQLLFFFCIFLYRHFKRSCVAIQSCWVHPFPL